MSIQVPYKQSNKQYANWTQATRNTRQYSRTKMKAIVDARHEHEQMIMFIESN